jgi:amino acid transporter/nucleotide-binding universal stress UspA family protein
MSVSEEPAQQGDYRPSGLLRSAQVIIVGSIMFTFISYWRTAAVVLCDLASTAYYIGGIVETAIGPAAPWFILAVMLFSYAVRSVYIESCSLFVRGGVYRVVKEAMGGFLAKLSVSALMFDYILTGPISGVSAGQYIVGLFLETLSQSAGITWDQATKETITNYGAAGIACIITLYFFWKNLIGIHESSDKALKIMIATTIMALIMLSWCLFTLYMRTPEQLNRVPWRPDLRAKVEYEQATGPDRVTGEPREMWKRDPGTGNIVAAVQNGAEVPKISKASGNREDPLGLMPKLFPGLSQKLREPANWWSFGSAIVGLLGLAIAFGHSILAMSGEETLAQVYREVESPKLANFKKAALIVFIYSLVLTAGISFLAVVLIPDEVRMRDYKDNLISGLAMYMYGPAFARLLLNAFVVIVGFLILAGAVNTAIIGSNGVLNRVAEDGVLPDWFLKPHRKYGTTSRLLCLIVGMQLFTILVSKGDVIVLSEAYAFGVVWSFVFKALAMVVLRFTDKNPREFKVPLNIKIGKIEIPVGLSVIFLILFTSAVLNLLTKEVATKWGLGFTAAFLTVFMISEHVHERRRRGTKHEHLEKFNQATAPEVSARALSLTKTYRKLVAIRSPQNLHMLEKTLAETDPETTDVIVMTAKLTPEGDISVHTPELDSYDQHLMTAVVDRAEKAGKEVRSLIIPTNNPLFAVIRTAHDLHVQELVMGASNKYTADEQLEQIAFYWINLHGGQPAPLTVRILGRTRDVNLDLGGGSRIPKISERKARSVAELRAAGEGIDRVLMVHNGTQESSDLFGGVLTMLDPQVNLTVVPVESHPGTTNGNGALWQQNLERAHQLGRVVNVQHIAGKDPANELLDIVREGKYDLIIVGVSTDQSQLELSQVDPTYIQKNAPCQVFLACPPAVPLEPEQAPPESTSTPPA